MIFNSFNENDKQPIPKFSHLFTPSKSWYGFCSHVHRCIQLLTHFTVFLKKVYLWRHRDIFDILRNINQWSCIHWHATNLAVSTVPLYASEHVEGILPKGPYLPCVSMGGGALLAGSPRCVIQLRLHVCSGSAFQRSTSNLLNHIYSYNFCSFGRAEMHTAP